MPVDWSLRARVTGAPCRANNDGCGWDNAGILLGIGALGTDLGLDSGLDIYTEVVDGAVRNIALLADRDADGTRVYTVNLTTGAVNRSATSGVLVQGAPLLDIAVDTAQ